MDVSFVVVRAVCVFIHAIHKRTHTFQYMSRVNCDTQVYNIQCHLVLLGRQQSALAAGSDPFSSSDKCCSKLVVDPVVVDILLSSQCPARNPRYMINEGAS